MQRRTDGESATLAKRRWTERDWDVAMEAQSFVAVFAEAAVAADALSEKKTSKKASKTKKTRRSKRSKAESDKDDAAAVTEAPVVVASEAFWLAQLQDDVTEDMLEDADAAVRITWLNRVGDGASNGARYEVAYDDLIDVQTILCHVFLAEVPGANAMELTAKSAARVQRCLRRTRGESTPEDDQDSEDEAPPVSKRKSKKAMKSLDEDDDDDRKPRRSSGGGGRRIANANVSKKVSKRIAAMHIPPLYTTVDLTKYTDCELRGDQVFDSCKGDLFSSNREIIRAVRTQNYELLTSLVEDKSLYKSIFSFRANQSVDVKKTALQYALEADDVKAVATILQAHELNSGTLASEPSVSLPSHSTGSHTSSFSDYNRRAINASRGGREGNNALLEDRYNVCSPTAELDFFWGHPSSSVKMLTALQPTGQWVNDSSTPIHVAKAARAGNYKLVSKMVEVLAKNGGWGYNDLHAAVLSTSNQDLPTFRSVSVVKKAQQTKVTPVHFAAINPNTKYLESLWESASGDMSYLRDDANFEPIHYAAANESPSAIRFLLEHKGNLLSRTKEKHTPLMISIINGREETAAAILEFVTSEDEESANQILSSRGPLPATTA